ncbi:hypothetical protein GCM10010306_056860 [Streptomyces umbrinus]|uniref:hypothetical protein n=1 Tax=Streptomyces umbrinus TaxID=67370 RepID=UPI0016768CD1|nr:hypothetical protein [Streptomyces umbrinus]GHB55590.1 hypothetical protein GCM10010306_056860 [Streptomyces umbrinus]
MTPDRFTPRRERRNRRPAWPRFLMALAALLCATCTVSAVGGHTGTRTAPPAAVSTESGLEHPHDLLDTALRPPARQGHRPLVPQRPARPPAPAHPRPRRHTHPVPPYAPTPRAQRCMVLRC